MSEYTPPLRVVICGSFHRDVEGLQRIIREFESHGCQILSPRSIEFTDTDQTFVKSPHETGFTEAEIERWHLAAIRQADLVWLHNPDGYVGLSAALEVGFAYAHRTPVFARQRCTDQTIELFSTRVGSVFDALERAAGQQA